MNGLVRLLSTACHTDTLVFSASTGPCGTVMQGVPGCDTGLSGICGEAVMSDIGEISLGCDVIGSNGVPAGWLLSTSIWDDSSIRLLLASHDLHRNSETAVLGNTTRAVVLSAGVP